MPSKKDSKGWLPSNWTLCKRLKQIPRDANDPPFFFREVRIGNLIVSILFNLSRLIYEATIHDISVILVASRLFLTTLQLVDHWWFCKNWYSFFIEKKMRAYMWFRFFVTLMMYSMIYCVQTTFPPYRGPVLISAGLQWLSGLQVMVWYYWGKEWDFRWGDMTDDRRIRAVVGTMFTIALIYVILGIYLFVASNLPLLNAMTPSITAVVAYFLMGLAFRYLDNITKRSTLACLKLLEDSKIESLAISGHNRSLLGNIDDAGEHQPSSSAVLSTPHESILTPLPSTRRRSQLMNSIQQVI